MGGNDPEEWGRLWRGIRELSDYFPEGIVFIGGVAVLLHVRSRKLPERFVELSHDGDFFVSLAAFADLRDLEEVTANRRLNKHQIVKDGSEYDVYLEGHNDLRVSYADVMESSEKIEEIRVASLEHLLILKLDAFAARKGSAKGRKDERDLVRIVYLLGGRPRRERLSKYLTAEMSKTLGRLEKSPELLAICGGNAHQARELRERITHSVERIVEGWRG